MAKIGVIEAYNSGRRAYGEGMDITNVPGHYSSIEQENWAEGWMQESINQLEELPDIGVSNLEDYYDDDNDIDELDFN